MSTKREEDMVGNNTRDASEVFVAEGDVPGFVWVFEGEFKLVVEAGWVPLRRSAFLCVFI